MIETVRMVSKETSVIRAKTISQNVTNTVMFIEKLLQGKRLATADAADAPNIRRLVSFLSLTRRTGCS